MFTKLLGNFYPAWQTWLPFNFLWTANSRFVFKQLIFAIRGFRNHTVQYSYTKATVWTTHDVASIFQIILSNQELSAAAAHSWVTSLIWWIKLKEHQLLVNKLKHCNTVFWLERHTFHVQTTCAYYSARTSRNPSKIIYFGSLCSSHVVLWPLSISAWFTVNSVSVTRHFKMLKLSLRVAAKGNRIDV